MAQASPKKQPISGLPNYSNDVQMNTSKGMPGGYNDISMGTAKTFGREYNDVRMETARNGGGIVASSSTLRGANKFKAWEKERLESPEVRRKATVAQLCE